MAVSVYCYFIKYQEKRKYLLPLHFKSSELKEIIYWKWVTKLKI